MLRAVLLLTLQRHHVGGHFDNACAVLARLTYSSTCSPNTAPRVFCKQNAQESQSHIQSTQTVKQPTQHYSCCSHQTNSATTCTHIHTPTRQRKSIPYQLLKVQALKVVFAFQDAKLWMCCLLLNKQQTVIAVVQCKTTNQATIQQTNPSQC